MWDDKPDGNDYTYSQRMMNLGWRNKAIFDLFELSYKHLKIK